MHMISLLCATLVLDSYTADQIVSFPKGDRGITAPYTWVTVLLDDDTVAGYHADDTGVHGESFLAKPFAVSMGKLSWLPLGVVEYGHVFGGAGNALVGDVAPLQGDGHPSMWKPDPAAGWSKASLTVLTKESGWAALIAPNGAIWIKVGKRWRALPGGSSLVDEEHFDLYGVDQAGRIFGNLYDGYGEGYNRLGEKPSMLANSKWIPLPTDNGSSTIAQVNRKGVAVGMAGNRAAMWVEGKLVYLETPKCRWSQAQSINDRGEIAGQFNVGQESHACVWKNGRMVDLIDAAPGVKLESAPRINSSGAIVAETSRGEKLFLLTPK